MNRSTFGSGARRPALIALLVIAPMLAVGLPDLRKLHALGVGPLGPVRDLAAEAAAEAAAADFETTTVQPTITAATALRALIPAADARAERLLVLETAANATGARIATARELAPVRPENAAYTWQVVEVVATGQFAQLVAFTHAIESGARVASVHHLDLARSASSACELTLTATLRFPVRDVAVDPLTAFNPPAPAQAGHP